jgi:hypothetical protein
MGRQVQLHILPQDCGQLLDFIRQRDPVVVTDWISQSMEIVEVQNTCQKGGRYCLWNQGLLSRLTRRFVPESARGPCYTVDSTLPVVELSYPVPEQEPWNGRPALTQGRIWAGFKVENRDFERWYNALARWIRKNFIKNPVPLLGGYLGPAAYEFYKRGGILLPTLRPPITSTWLSWVEAQDQHRAVFSK